MVHHADGTRTTERVEPGLIRRLAAMPVFWLGLTVVFAAILTGIIELASSVRHRREQEANAPVPIPKSELERRRLVDPVGEKTPVEMKLYGLDHVGTTQHVAVVPGRVRARLVVWSYAEDRFVCVSPSVEVDTPPVDFMSTSNGDGFTQTEDPVLKARVETVIAAAITARDHLRVVAER